jgi:hypothetical protein
MLRLNRSTMVRERWPIGGLVLALLSAGTSARAAFSWSEVPNDGTHFTQSGPALVRALSDSPPRPFDCGPYAPPPGLEQLHVFAIKDDGKLWEDIGSPSSPWSWAGWQNGDLSTNCNANACDFTGSNPSATQFTYTSQGWTNQLAVVARNTSTQVAWANIFIGDPTECYDRDWLGWQAIPGLFVNDIAVTFFSPYLYVFGEGQNGMMYTTHVDVNSYPNWTTPAAIPNGWFSGGAAATVVDGKLFVVGRASDNNYYWSQSSDGTNFTAWGELPAFGFQTAPAISGWSGGHLDVSGIVGAYQELYHSTSDNYGLTWTGFSQLDNSLTHYPPASFSYTTGGTYMAQTEGYYASMGAVWVGDGP